MAEIITKDSEEFKARCIAHIERGVNVYPI